MRERAPAWSAFDLRMRLQGYSELGFTHSFVNAAGLPARVQCIGMLKHLGKCAGRFATLREHQRLQRTSPELDKAAQAVFMKKAKELAPKYRTELLGP